MEAKRIIYFCGGAADIISAHKSWKSNTHHPSEVSLTFSGQIAEACKNLALKAHLIAPAAAADLLVDGDFTLEHRIRHGGTGFKFHFNDARYAISLINTALQFKADIALIDTGAANIYWFIFLRLFGVEIVPILHNTLWPSGFPPTTFASRIILFLDKISIWKSTPSAVLSVSPECERQVRGLAPTPPYPHIQIRAQFNKQYFEAIGPSRFPDEHKTFNILFIGRVTREKGVFDILEMARMVEQTCPGRVKWVICGRGPDLEKLKARHDELGLKEVVIIRDWVSLEQLSEIYETTHASIVPTTSGFAEGLAMTAVESVLAGRPVVVSSVVPAGEVLQGACLIGQANAPAEIAKQVIKICSDKQLYQSLQAKGKSISNQFYDREYGLTRALEKIVSQT